MDKELTRLLFGKLFEFVPYPFATNATKKKTRDVFKRSVYKDGVMKGKQQTWCHCVFMANHDIQND